MSLPYIEHVGIIVHDLDRSLAFFERLFDIKPSEIREMAASGFKAAELRAQNISIELIQCTGEDESFGKKVMGPTTGINHLSLRVKDIVSSLKDFEDKGVKVMPGFPGEGSYGPMAYFDPSTTEGILLEMREM